MTKNYVYDAAGNLTNDGIHTYEYDAENRLKSVDNGAAGAYAYDYQNRRIKKLVGATSTHYVWEGNQVISEHDGTTGAVLYNYVYSGSKLIARMGSGIINWYLSDRLSTRLVLDNSGNVLGRQGHLPFGEDFGESGTQEKHHLTSYERDSESGSDYAVNRQYAQTLGRFNRVDPVEGFTTNPQSLNRYAYVQSDPIDRMDPLGLYSFCMLIPVVEVAGAYDAMCWNIYTDPKPPREPGSGGGQQLTADQCKEALDKLYEIATAARSLASFVLALDTGGAGQAGEDLRVRIRDRIDYLRRHREYVLENQGAIGKELTELGRDWGLIVDVTNPDDAAEVLNDAIGDLIRVSAAAKALQGPCRAVLGKDDRKELDAAVRQFDADLVIYRGFFRGLIRGITSILT